MDKTKNLIIVGDSAFAEIAYEYFLHDSNYSISAFSVEEKFIKKASLFGIPVVPFETLPHSHPPKAYDVYVAIPYTQLNRLRTRLAASAKQQGYHLASYISSKSFVWSNVKIGEHCFIFENNTIQPFCNIEDNVILWSGNHIGHHSTIRNNCFISSHVVISGFCDIGENYFLGVNSTLANNITVGQNNWVGPSTTIMKNTPDNAFFKTETAISHKLSSLEFFKL